MIKFTEEHKKKISDALINRYKGIPFGKLRKDGGYIICKYCKKEKYINKKGLNKVLFCNKKCYFDYKNNIFNPLKGFKHSEKSKQNIKIGHNKALLKESYHKNLSNSLIGIKRSDITKEKIRQNTIRQHVKGLFPQTNTLPERIIEQKLKDNNIKFEHPYPFGRFVCDFAIPEYKLIIECDGDYWHNREDIKKKDKAKNKYLEVSGWNILRFWEHDIKSNPDKCIESIKEKICN